MLTRITDWKIPCVHIHVYQIMKNWGPGPYNSLRHADNRRYFSGLSLTRNRREAHMFYLAKEVGKIWTCSCWEKGNFIMINKFKYGQTWKIWPSPLSLSLYSTFKHLSKVVWDRKNIAKSTRSSSSISIDQPVLMTDVKNSKYKYISRRIDWENLIYLRWNSIKNLHKKEDGDQ